MDLSNLAPIIAQHLGIQPSTLVLILTLAIPVARAVSRSIPDDAKGVLAFVRQLTAIVGVEVSNKVTSGVTTADAARVAIGIAPPEKVEAVRDAIDAVAEVRDALR